MDIRPEQLTPRRRAAQRQPDRITVDQLWDRVVDMLGVPDGDEAQIRQQLFKTLSEAGIIERVEVTPAGA